MTEKRKTCRAEHRSASGHSALKSLHENAKGNTDKIGTDANPVDFAEDDIFGYMRAEKGQGKNKEIVDETVNDNPDNLFAGQENAEDAPEKDQNRKS